MTLILFMKKTFIALTLLIYCGSAGAKESVSRAGDTLLCDTINSSGSCKQINCCSQIPADTNSVTLKHENKKFVAALLAFPLPFGILGLHRIYLGTKPYVPFVYIGTVGGCFGILPILDFITILRSSKQEIKTFEGNPKVFMWAH